MADDLGRYRQIATLQHDAPIPELRDGEPTWTSAAELAGTWGLKALAKRLRERASAS
jgi:hypothetical protein